jgi:hypothetical protein
MIDSSTLINLATMGVASLAMPNATNKAKFTDNTSGITTTIIIILVIILIIWIMVLMAIYKLTNSVLQTVLCLFFGIFYIAIALIYYGFSGYKFVKKA